MKKLIFRPKYLKKKHNVTFKDVIARITFVSNSIYQVKTIKFV